MNKVLLLFVFIYLSISAFSQESWENILSSHDISCLKYHNGIIYAGALNGGLIMVNTKTGKIQNLTKANSELPSNNIRAIEISETGTIWIATDEGLVTIENNKWTVTSTIPGYKPIYEGQNSLKEVSRLALDMNGNLWMLCYFHVIRYSDKGFKVFNYESDEFPLYRASAVYCDKEGNTWFGGVGGSILRIDRNDSLSGINTYHYIPHTHTISAITIDEESKKLVFGFKDEYRTWIGCLADTIFSEIETGQGYFVTDLKYDQKKTLWVGFYSGGLRNIENDIIQSKSYHIPDTFTFYSLNSDRVNAILIDPDSTLWMGTSGGLYAIKDTLSTYYPTSAYGHFNPKVNLISNYNKEILFGTEFGLFAFNKNGIYKKDPYTLSAHNDFTFLQTDDSNHLWTNFRYYNGTEWIKYSIKSGTKDYTDIRGFTIDHQNNKWFSAYTKYSTNYTLAYFDHPDWIFYNKENLGFMGYISKMVRGNKDTIYAISQNGIAYFNGDSWAYINKENTNLPSNNIGNLYYDSKTKLLWACLFGDISNGEGKNKLVSFNGSEFTIYDIPIDPSKSFYSYDLKIDHFLNIWIGTDNGLFRMDNLGVWTSYTTENSPITSNNIKSIFVDETNRKWFIANNGITLLSDMPVIKESNKLYLFPNPANASSQVQFRITEKQKVVLRVLDISGREVEVLINKELAPNDYSKTFDCSQLLNGIYFLELTTPYNRSAGKLIVINSKQE